MTTQLNAANLNLLDQNIQVPKYDRQKVGQSIMHVRVGGFHRAHQALYMDDLLHQGGDSHWGYCGVGLLKHDARLRDVMLHRIAFTRSWSGVWTATKLESLARL
jgi:mannitol 2-dehydrogenase